MIAINAIRDTFLYAFKYPLLPLAPLVPGLISILSFYVVLEISNPLWLGIVLLILAVMFILAATAWTVGVIIIAVADIEIYGEIKASNVLGEAFSWIVPILFMSFITSLIVTGVGIIPVMLAGTILGTLGLVVVDTVSTFSDPRLLFQGLSILGFIFSVLLIAWPIFVALAMGLALPARVASTQNPGRAITLAWETARKNIFSLVLLNVFIIILFFLVSLISVGIPDIGPILGYILPFYIFPVPLVLFYMKATDATPEEFGLRQEYESPPD